ncbi:unnamed protein product [Porites evermanni]|uniref:Armadillo repeat-containing protein 5 n=1 Tax=Porites evermanni TaxID=104178 RepID=A0ABN8SSF3_9CNID|nr:unnamed protein product [Porites evermanni]
MTSITSPWDFKHLEIVGSRVSRPAELSDIRGRIPELKVETRKRIAVKKEPETEPRRPRSPAKRESLLHFKPKKEKVVAVKVVLPKKKSEITERNYLCSCERYSSGSSNDEEKEPECDIEFSQLMDIFTNYKEKRTNIRNLTNIARGFHERRILSNDEAIKVLKLLDADNWEVKESILLTIGQLCSSTVNVKRFLENGLLAELINLMLLGRDDDIKKEAVVCLSKVVEKSEHAHLWLEAMTISGVGTLFGLLNSSPSLQHAALLAIKNLASHPKMAQVFLEYGLDGVAQLTTCKNTQGKYIGDTDIQGLVTQALTNLISNDSSTVEMFLSKHAAVIGNVLDLLQYSPCPQQQQSARFLATLAYYKTGLTSLISHNATEHLMWAVTCSQCRHLREQASIALKNISTNPDRTSAFSALSQVATGKANLEQEASCYSNSAGSFSSPPLKKSSRTSGDVDIELDKQLTLKPNKVTSELTSVLTLVFQGDSLGRSGSERQFMTPSSSFHLKSTRLKRSNNFSKKETYLSSLRVLTNALVVMSNLILLSESMEELSVEDRRLNHVAVMIQNGGLAFLRELEFLSNKLLKVNPPLFHNIDPTTLPPKEISTTLKHARTDLIFEAANKRTQDSTKKYADFGFESTEVDFVKAAVQLLCLFAQTTAPQFDPCLEDMKVLESSRSKDIKRHISFHKSAVLVKNALRLTKGSERRRIIRSRSARSLSRSLSQVSVDTSTSSNPSKPSSATDMSTPSAQVAGAQDSLETTHYVKQSLLDAKIIYCLAPWIMCGIYDIQSNVLKTIRYLQHNKYASSGPGTFGNHAPREAWSSKPAPALISRSSNLSQRSSNAATPARIGMNKSKYLAVTCVRHVIQHCGSYLLDSLGPPVPPTLGMTTLMVLREAVMNGEHDTRLKIIKLGCFAEVIDYIRGHEDNERLQALGIVVIRILVGNDVSFKQLFFAHGGMNLIMALHQYKEGMVKEEAALTMSAFRRGYSRVHRRCRTADARIKKRQKSHDHGDIWDEVGEKWKGQDEVVKVLKKFNLRY